MATSKQKSDLENLANIKDINNSKIPETGSWRLKGGLAQMLKGGVIMDVVNSEEAKIAEASGGVYAGNIIIFMKQYGIDFAFLCEILLNLRQRD